MGQVKVLDTGVLIGVAVAQDQHHQACLDYIANSDSEPYITPAVGGEFTDILEGIRDQLSSEIKKHRRDIIKRVGQTTLDRTDLVKIREEILETDFNAHRFLYEFYEAIAGKEGLSRSDLTNMLSDMATEVYYDGAEEYGGVGSLISKWTRDIEIDSEVEGELLIYESDDPIVCLEAHHIAKTVQENTELGTTNPEHFIRQQCKEPESREENILRVTALDDIVDLSMGKYP